MDKQWKWCITATRWYGIVVYVQPACTEMDTQQLKELKRYCMLVVLRPNCFTVEPPHPNSQRKMNYITQQSIKKVLWELLVAVLLFVFNWPYETKRFYVLPHNHLNDATFFPALFLCAFLPKLPAVLTHHVCLSVSWGHNHKLQDTAFALHHLSLLITSVSGLHASLRHGERQRKRQG